VSVYGPCVRRAWLVLGSQTVLLDNPAGGWFCQSLDLGAPVVREVTNNNPDRNGQTDRTQYMAGRVVTIAVTALAGARAQIDAVASQFSPFMDPSQRPVLHYVLDRPGAAERTMTLRAQSYDWPIVGADERDVALQFLAADPVALDPVQQSAIAWAGSSSGQGRIYSLTFPRVYPTGGGSSTSTTIVTHGDLPIRPLLRIYGPITAPVVGMSTPGSSYQPRIGFVPSFTIAAGAYVEVDTATKTARLAGDPTQSVANSVDWQNCRWPYLPPAPASTIMVLFGSSTSGFSQVQALWNDRYYT
jgi:hypothetical protein